MRLRKPLTATFAASLVAGSVMMADAFPLHQAMAATPALSSGATALLGLCGAMIGLSRLSRH